MAEEVQNTTEQIGTQVTKIEQFIENNKKTILIVVGVVVVLIVAFFAYKKLYLEKKQAEAQEAMYPAQHQFSIDSFNIALYGNENVTGFVDIIAEYSNTKAGNVANYYAACCAMRLGQYEDAISYLDDFSTDDPILESEAICLKGDAYSSLENYEKAISLYKKAAKVADNEYLSPRYLIKAGIHYEKMGKYKDAIVVYTQIKEDFSGSMEAASIEKTLTKLKFIVK